MIESDETISKALADLAERSPRGAPPEIGVRLRDAFRTHHARLRRNRLIAGIAVAGVFAAVAVLVSFKAWPPVSRTGGQENNFAGTPVQPPPLPRTADSKDRTISQEGRVTLSLKDDARRWRKKAAANAGSPFIPLPTYDPVVRPDGYEILRVKLRDTALSELGLPVREGALGRSVLADLLVDKDGIPLAVRFVGPRGTQ